jgi:mono/diheme cytochrome c family protein
MEILLKKVRIIGCLTLAALGIGLAVAKPQEGPVKIEQGKQTQPLIGSLKGADLFRAYCAPCHGDDGKGNGPVAPALNTKPADLTTIAARNGGVFPAQRVSKIIAGDDLVLAHGSREMPVWGPIFHQVERDQDLGHVRLQNIVKYVESIQQKRQ